MRTMVQGDLGCAVLEQQFGDDDLEAQEACRRHVLMQLKSDPWYPAAEMDVTYIFDAEPFAQVRGRMTQETWQVMMMVAWMRGARVVTAARERRGH